MRFGVLAVDGCFDSGLVAVLDVLRVGDALRAVAADPVAPITVATTGVSSSATTSGGLRLEVDVALSEAANEFDVLVLPAVAGFSPEQISAQLRRGDIRQSIDALANLDLASTSIAAACTGTFLAGDAGLLNEQRATTSWWLAPFFQQRYPTVELDMSAMVVRSDKITTAGAAFGHVDLALDLLAGVSPALASLAARYLVIDRRPAQSAYFVLSHLAAADPVVAEFEAHVRRHLTAVVNVANIGRVLGVNRRTLERRVRAATGLSPARFVAQIRLEHADHLRRTTDWSADRIAHEIGYSDASALRRARRQRNSTEHE